MPYARDDEAAVSWAKQLKTRFPHIKVLVTNCLLHPVSEEDRAAPGGEGKTPPDRFAVPNTPEAAITNGIREAVIHAGDPDYTLAEGVDTVTKNVSALVVNNTLRDLLGMEHLQAKSRSR